MRRALLLLVVTTGASVSWADEDPEHLACDEYVVDRDCGVEPGEDIGEPEGPGEEELRTEPQCDDSELHGIEGPIPDDTPGNPAPSADELRVSEVPVPSRVPYELGDLDVSELGYCAPLPSCVAPMLRATSPEASVIVFDGRTLVGTVIADHPVLVVDVPRGRLLELPKSAQVQLSARGVRFCTTSCQTIDLRDGAVELHPSEPLTESPSATSPAPGAQTASSST